MASSFSVPVPHPGARTVSSADGHPSSGPGCSTSPPGHRSRWRFWIALARWGLLVGVALLFFTETAAGQIPDEFSSTPLPEGEGWMGFTDVDFLFAAFLKLVLAAILGAVVGYHPRSIRTTDTIEEVEAPKVSIVYGVIGCFIGILVIKYGLTLGFVLFGIGALMRFRTRMRSPKLTGQVILVTLIGLTCGMSLPHVAVLATGFDFVLTFILEARVTYRIEVRGLPTDRFTEAAQAYREILSARRYSVLSERMRPDKGRISFIFRSPGRDTRGNIEAMLAEQIDPSLRGSVNWEVD